MLRKIFLFVLFLALGLTACKSATQSETATGETATAVEAKTPVTTPSATTIPKKPNTLQVPNQAPNVPGCTVVSYNPTPDPSSLFPQITTEDWYRGPLTATVKLIEYSDFQ